MTSAKTQIRCAIYTRKSSEEGLEQSFNSLHAQREACEAYVLSQRHEGWQLLANQYDDGGFSGGNMERPGLKKLIADIASDKIDTVVVYKVDRLTRALSDFAKIVDAFDKQGVSFVSVTQQFNTTTSMGRLTLNVLLSFAQFEREVTGERIRDKVAASKKKGMWMGGHVPKGYDRVEGKLIVNAKEAVAVRNIFLTYLECGCVRRLAERLKHSGIRSKRWTSSTGRQRGGVILSRGSLYHRLNNPIYIGKIAHQGKLHDGQHEPILDLQIWSKVAAMLKDNRVARRIQGNIPSGRLLLGKLVTSDGQSYTPTHAAKKGRRYFYYILTGSGRGSSVNIIKRLPADELESRVLSSIGSFLEDSPRLSQHFETLDVRELRLLTSAAKHRAAQLSETTHPDTRDFIFRIVEKIVVEKTELSIFLSGEQLSKSFLGDVPKGGSLIKIQLREPISFARRGSAVKLILSNGDSKSDAPIASLVRAVVQARTWSDWIVSGKVRNLDQLAEKAGLNKRYASRILRLAALSPTLYEAILAGDHSPLLTVSLFTKSLPLDWGQQRLAG
ncbi:recombinase family protein [Tunturiibacter lichenicola]|uniref:recombinase family protein n=1 Tax=Tunturiibacter lichenicola TaxID=2051959 RepID=UPI0021B41937|nr:recombinase family protein [Edaphobacter lichenicola]